jgi:hypothetical protein
MPQLSRTHAQFSLGNANFSEGVGNLGARGAGKACRRRKSLREGGGGHEQVCSMAGAENKRARRYFVRTPH